MPRWLARTLAGLAALGVAWFAAYWYFGRQYMDDLALRSQLSEQIAAAKKDGRAVTLTLNGAGLDGRRVVLSPHLQDGRIVDWRCRSDAPPRTLPAMCRNPL